MHQCDRSLGEHGCAECLRNRTHFKRVWVHRLMLESKYHETSSFLTLTYSDLHLPLDYSLNPEHLTLWLKRFRAAIYPKKIRYFAVGEYGDDTQRPHYHAALFGVGPEAQDIVHSTWGMGHVMLGTLNIQSCRYVAGYVTKKMTSPTDYRLQGRHPEFTRMSRKPGIGKAAVADIVNTLDCEAGAELLRDDVPSALTISGRPLPLGDYMRSKIKDAVYDTKNPLYKLSNDYASAIERNKKAEAKMQSMFEDYCRSSMSKKMTFLQYLKEVRKQKNLNLTSQFKLNQKGTL
nr:MAG: replication initiator protein [Microvirus sp.]